MEYSASSIHFLYAAYILMGIGQLGYIVFLAARWAKVHKPE